MGSGKADGHSCNCRPNRGGYSRARGDVASGGGRGLDATGPTKADKVEVDADPEAHMNLEFLCIHKTGLHDLQSELLHRSDPVSTPELDDDTDSAGEDCTVSTVKTPVFQHPGGPVPLPVVPPCGLHWVANSQWIF